MAKITKTPDEPKEEAKCVPVSATFRPTEARDWIKLATVKGKGKGTLLYELAMKYLEKNRHLLPAE